MKDELLKKIFKVENFDHFFARWFDNNRDYLLMESTQDKIGYCPNFFRELILVNNNLAEVDLHRLTPDEKRYIQKQQDNLFSNHVYNWLLKQYEELVTSIVSNPNFTPEGVKARRDIATDNPEEFIESLERGKFTRGYSGLGHCWSWGSSPVSSEWSRGKYNVTIEAFIPWSSIDIPYTLDLNLHINLGKSEKEIRTFDDKRVYVHRVSCKEKNIEREVKRSLPCS